MGAEASPRCVSDGGSYNRLDDITGDSIQQQFLLPEWFFITGAASSSCPPSLSQRIPSPIIRSRSTRYIAECEETRPDLRHALAWPIDATLSKALLQGFGERWRVALRARWNGSCCTVTSTGPEGTVPRRHGHVEGEHVMRKRLITIALGASLLLGGGGLVVAQQSGGQSATESGAAAGCATPVATPAMSATPALYASPAASPMASPTVCPSPVASTPTS